MVENTYDTIIVGGGVAGLTATAYLAREGQKVLLIEKNRELGGSDFDVQVDYENQPIFYAKGYVNIGYDEHGNYQVIDISIGEAGFQWPDFEAELPNKYINQLEIFCKE
jgi:NADPH-dependent 2,4-dienoyl-CoA reductase/sulfur reductase-like enzyme